MKKHSHLTTNFTFGDSKDKPSCETKVTVTDKISNNSPYMLLIMNTKLLHLRKVILFKNLKI